MEGSYPRLARQTSSGRIRWAVLLARIYEVLPLLCPACGGSMTILAFLTDPPVVSAILLHIRRRLPMRSVSAPRLRRMTVRSPPSVPGDPAAPPATVARSTIVAAPAAFRVFHPPLHAASCPPVRFLAPSASAAYHASRCLRAVGPPILGGGVGSNRALGKTGAGAFFIGDPPAPLSRGAWHKVQMEFKGAAGPLVFDGVQRMWIDGSLLVDITDGISGPLTPQSTTPP